MPRRARKLGAALAVVALVATLLAALLRSEPRYAGSNSVRAVSLIQPLEPGRTLCQKGELVPGEAATIEFVVGTGGQPGPPLVAELRAMSGRVRARGRVRGGYGDGVVGVPIPVQHETRTRTDVCVRATAPSATQVYGQTNAEGKLEANGKPVPGVLRIAYKRPGSETWLALAPTIAHRFAQAKTRVATPFTFWALLVAVLAVAGVAVREALRDDGEEQAVA